MISELCMSKWSTGVLFSVHHVTTASCLWSRCWMSDGERKFIAWRGMVQSCLWSAETQQSSSLICCIVRYKLSTFNYVKCINLNRETKNSSYESTQERWEAYVTCSSLKYALLFGRRTRRRKKAHNLVSTVIWHEPSDRGIGVQLPARIDNFLF
jgi:hypothetical protein